jgi:hypothetical protein
MRTGSRSPYDDASCACTARHVATWWRPCALRPRRKRTGYSASGATPRGPLPLLHPLECPVGAQPPPLLPPLLRGLPITCVCHLAGVYANRDHTTLAGPVGPRASYRRRRVCKAHDSGGFFPRPLSLLIPLVAATLLLVGLAAATSGIAHGVTRGGPSLWRGWLRCTAGRVRLGL